MVADHRRYHAHAGHRASRRRASPGWHGCSPCVPSEHRQPERRASAEPLGRANGCGVLCCEIETKPAVRNRASPCIRLAGQDLNPLAARTRSRAALPDQVPRRKTCSSEAVQDAPDLAGDRRTHGMASGPRLSHWFRVGHSRTRKGRQGLRRGRRAVTLLHHRVTPATRWSEVSRGAWDIVDRWRARRRPASPEQPGAQHSPN
ncbi:MAG: hypothetical protein MZV70_52215 [Desulfobacterales bacterium]|nr:hypothetical protein [Desulfobacterales bacterium]